jgi:N-acetylneuraminic acid mutarotase
VTATDGSSGIALVEVYDGSRGFGPSIVNASTRAFVGTGESVLVPGFVISGSGSLRLLIRAVGPTLAGFGVSGTIVDPAITLYRGSTVLATNDNWWTAANVGQLTAVSVAVGAFPLGFESRDAAVLVDLEPGAYSAVVSGVGGVTGTALVELYVVPPTPAVLAEGQWGMRADLIAPNSEMSVAELDGKIYVVGGYPSNRVSVPTVQVYDIAKDTWQLTTPLPVGLNHTVSAGVSGKLYVIGGQSSAGGAGPFVDTVYAFDPLIARWTPRAPMPTQRGGGAGAVVGGKIYIAGGRPPRGNDFAVYDPALDTWRTLPDLPTQRNHIGAAAIDGKIYFVGGRLAAGFESEQTDRVEVYDPVTNLWTTRAPMLRPRGGVNAVAAYGYLHVFGGEGNDDVISGVYPDHDVYNPATNTWMALKPMPVPVHGVTGASFVNGVIHLTGGGIADGGENGTTLHQVFRPATSYR